MKLKFFNSILLLFFMCIMNAQNYRVFYEVSYKIDSISDKLYKKSMILDLDENIETFYSYKMYQSDSLYEENIKNRKENFGRFLDYDFAVKKNIKKKELYKYYRLSFGNIFKIREELPEFKWEILGITKKIGNFNCQKAVTVYKGRKWEAWFTSEIPIPKGPYLFEGLPGLIILIADNKSNFIFELNSIEKQKTPLIFYEENAVLISRVQLKKLYLDYYNDPFKELKLNDTKVKIENSFGGVSDPNFNEITKKKRLELKRYNNPIELSEVINYP
ncbi:GLPGLI family protein [Chryseobacterium sp. GP-SGM7]|uniref:GLPGLI family protein n=1 Tax=Chryseobacterium sp. GP-SGM7 TaxID=3411323 RepID=UPI003B93C96C